MLCSIHSKCTVISRRCQARFPRRPAMVKKSVTIQSSLQQICGEVSEGWNPSDIQSFSAACTAGTGAFLRREACRPEQKYLPCGFAARKSSGFQANPEGVGRRQTLWVCRSSLKAGLPTVQSFGLKRGTSSAGGLSARKTAQCAVFSENGSADPWALAPPSESNCSVCD